MSTDASTPLLAEEEEEEEEEEEDEEEEEKEEEEDPFFGRNALNNDSPSKGCPFCPASGASLGGSIPGASMMSDISSCRLRVPWYLKRVTLKFSVKISGLSVYIFISQCKYFATLNIITIQRAGVVVPERVK